MGGSAFQGVTLKMFHGGKFKNVGNKVVYLGRQCKTYKIDPDELSWWDLLDRAKECGNYIDIESIHYMIPGKGFDNGLRRVYNDDEAREMGQLLLQTRCLDLFVVHGNSESLPSPTSVSLAPPTLSSQKAERPAKLTPKRAPNVPFIKSPRATSKSVLVEPTNILPEPNNTNRPNIRLFQEFSPTPNPTTNYFPDFPEVIFLDTQASTTEENTFNAPEKTTLAQTKSPKQKHTTPCTTITTKSVPEDYEWEDPRPESPIPYNELVGNYFEDEYGDDEKTESEYEPESENSEEEADCFEDEGEYDEKAEEEYDDEEHALDKAGLEELNGDNPDTSDDEYLLARERVKGCNARLLEISQQLQIDASEGRLGSQLRKEALNVGRSEHSGEHVSDYELSDEEIHTPPDSGEDETLEQRRSKRSLLVSLDADFSVFKWKVGQRFATRADFKQAVAKYGIYQGRNVSIKISNKSRQQRVGVRCLDGCPFQLYGSWDSRRSTFVVKTVEEEHTCTRNMKKNKQLKITWLAEQLLDVFKARPHWPGQEIVETVRRGFKVVINVDFAYKVKQTAHRMLHGSMKDHYGKVGRYIEALKKCSPRTHIALISTMKKDRPRPQVFQRLFVSFEGLQKGWKEGCRKIICVDACFLKIFLGGQLLSAVGRDGNDQMYPIAWAVVEGENNLSWEWFFLQLQMCLDLGEGQELVIVSDEHQSILSGVASVFPMAEHRHCARHVFALWHKSFRGDEMKLAFWNIVKAYNNTDYNEALQNLSEKNPDAATAFKGYNPDVFCRSHMKTNVKADVVTNNMAETFNGYIIRARTKHLIYMLEDIRTALMQRLVLKRKEVEKWKSDISPRILVKLEMEKSEASLCDVLPSTNTLFQVNYYLDSLNVDLEAKTCTCKKWDMCGIPCCHACAAIFFCQQQPEDYVDACYKKSTYLKAYSVSIPPLEGERHWPNSDLHLDPPPIKIGPGRPRKNRRKDPFEDPKRPGKLTKHGMEMTCSICKLKGHNKRRCPNKNQAQNVEPAPKRPRGRPRSETHSPRTQTQTEPQHHVNTAEPTRLGRGGRVILSGKGSRGGGRNRGGGTDSVRGRGRGRGNDGGGGTDSARVGGRGRNSDCGTSSARGAGNTGGRGRGRGGRGRGRGDIPVGFGVFVTQDGSSFTNVPGGSGPRSVTNSTNSTICGANFSQGSTSGHAR